MATNPHHLQPGAGRILLTGATAALLALTAASTGRTEPASGTESTAAHGAWAARPRPSTEATPLSARDRPGEVAQLVVADRRRGTSPSSREVAASVAGYGWPVKPFHRQHPVRGFFGDPRIGGHDSTQFHFGVDVSAPNGTPVFATITGTVAFIGTEAISVAGSGGVAFEYWHIAPSVRSGQRVQAYETVVGHILRPWAHVHLSELRNGLYVNPLRAGALRPFADDTVPSVDSIRVRRHGAAADLTADVSDETPLVVREPWANLPVMPAVVRWRVGDRPWTTTVDFRITIPDASAFASVYAGPTEQNHARRPGRYRILLAVDVAFAKLSRRVVAVQVLDVSGNSSVARLRVP